MRLTKELIRDHWMLAKKRHAISSQIKQFLVKWGEIFNLLGS